MEVHTRAVKIKKQGAAAVDCVMGVTGCCAVRYQRPSFISVMVEPQRHDNDTVY